MSTFTIAQLLALLALLNKEDTLVQTIRSILNTDATERKQEEEERVFWKALELVKKVVSPEDIIVTRPQHKCTYRKGDGRSDFYQMRFWYRGYGHINRGGDVSDFPAHGGSHPKGGYCSPEGYCLLAEVYTKKPQDGGNWRCEYPNHAVDLSDLFSGYRWVRKTESFEFRVSTEKVDIFTLVKKDSEEV